MVNLHRTNASLRLTQEGDMHRRNIRTFTGVRHNLLPERVATLIEGVNAVRSPLDEVTNAVLTVRAELVKGV